MDSTLLTPPWEHSVVVAFRGGYVQEEINCWWYTKQIVGIISRVFVRIMILVSVTAPINDTRSLNFKTRLTSSGSQSWGGEGVRSWEEGGFWELGAPPMFFANYHLNKKDDSG